MAVELDVAAISKSWRWRIKVVQEDSVCRLLNEDFLLKMEIGGDAFVDV